MNQGFQNTLPLLARTADGRNFVLAEPLVYVSELGHTYRAPAGATTDGLSTPPEIWPLIPPFGKPWYSGVLHDAAYRQYLQILCEDDSWKDVVLTQEQADCLIDEAMESQGVEDVERDAIFRALESFGNKAFAQDAIDATARKASQGGLTPAATQ